MKKVAKKKPISRNTLLLKKYAKARGEEKQALLETLFNENRGLVHGFAIKCLRRSNHTYWLDADDLVATFNICFVNAVNGFKPDLGFEFSTYLTQCMYYKFKDLPHYEYNVPRKTSIADLKAYQAKFRDTNIDNISILDREVTEDLLPHLKRILQPIQVDVLTSLFLEEKPPKDVAKQLKVSRQRVHQIKQSAIQLLIKNLKREDFI